MKAQRSTGTLNTEPGAGSDGWPRLNLAGKYRSSKSDHDSTRTFMTCSNAWPRAKVQDGIRAAYRLQEWQLWKGKELNDAMASVLSELGAPLSGITLSGGHPSLRSGFCGLSGYLSASVLWFGGEHLDQHQSTARSRNETIHKLQSV